MRYIIVFSLLFLSCTTSGPVLHEIPNKMKEGEIPIRVEIHHTKKLFGIIPVSTEVEKVESPKQVDDRLDREKKEAEQAITLKRKQRQENFTFLLGAGLLILAVVFVFAGVMVQGYVKFYLLAIVSVTLGALTFGFASWLPYLKWTILPLIATGLFFVMKGTKDFHLPDWWRSRGSN